MESRSKRRRNSVEQAPLPTIPPTSSPGVSTHPEPPGPPDNKRRRTNPPRRKVNPPRRSPSTAPSMSSVDHPADNTWEERKSQAESRINKYECCGRSNEQCLTKTLNAALNWLPEGGKDLLADDIVIAEGDETLWEVFDNLRTAVIETIRSTGKTPCVTPSPHHKRQASVERVAAKLPDPQVRSPAWAKDCIDRDNHRCVISGAATEAEWAKNGGVEGELWGKLEGDHNIAVKWASIYTAFPQMKARMRASRINSLENGITLHNLVHVEFQAFKIALQPTERTNYYSVKKYPRFDSILHPHIQNGTMVTLRQADGHQEKPLPGREFLDTHFRLCEIFHASGLAKEVEDNYRRWDQIKQQASGHSLLEDGSTNVAEILQTALFSVV
ncbi:hypothetical protein N7516_005793 [Penicillium verrucosum]|uniref:uncharacterized protein n=1 Tax=Penicillium verrucosum TaxID=60171 RepID=UPI0025454041|nr:uncharacterized protein N7516_005793 [Penicillium verrucosum]KAJ5931304.1 hypothetical protein N7516_005793 [Penicillium verrucosum]